MSPNLWRYLLEDDVDSFRQYLANATVAATVPKAFAAGQGGYSTLKAGSPGSLAISPKTPLKTRKSSGYAPSSAGAGKVGGVIVTRAELNSKDNFGRTLLHHAASIQSQHSLPFVKALLELPLIDLYAQDTESGWTALHRALYFGNISVAQALMARDIQDATDYTTNTARTHAGGLVKIKDHEGNSPFEVFGLTIAPRRLQEESSTLPDGIDDNESVISMDYNDAQDHERHRPHVHPQVSLDGDEVYAFGSNKNLSLGVGDGDDRQFPERLHFSRPDHLLRRLLDDHQATRQGSVADDDLTSSIGHLRSQEELPAIVRYKPITIQNVVMSKLHTAVLTTDPISNLYMCGFGAGGRLGTGDENTSFTYKCIQAGGLSKRHVSAVALGQDHTVAVCSQGEVYTWGSNRHGQLGYSLPEVPKNEIPMQLTPRQVYGYIKKELVLGAAASAIHSAVFTSTALYTFGKNEGQLGLMDADARSLDLQDLPRRVGVSILQSPIQSVSAIDRATIVLLATHDVIVFTHYGWTKVLFPLETFSNYYLEENTATRLNVETNYIKQITGGGNTICAMSSFGEVYSIDVPKVSENVPSNTSTTNPTKARNALAPPTRLWSIRKSHMSAIDVAVGQDGSIVLCTASGSVWRKEKRANIKSVREKHTGLARTKDYKFVRVPNLTRAIAVRSNAFGAFMAIRKDCAVTREQIVLDPPSLWDDMFPLLVFARYGESQGDSVHSASIRSALITQANAEQDILNICKRHDPLLPDSQFNFWITSNTTDVRIPAHGFILKARSRVLRSALTEFQETYYYTIPDVLSIEYGPDGQIQLIFHGADFLTIANLVFYFYTENIADVWHYTSKALQSAARYRLVRLELMKIAHHLELRHLERAVRIMTEPARTLNNDMEVAVLDVEFFSDADVLVELAGGIALPAHSVLLCARCPFFDGLFNGRAGGMWMASRRHAAAEESEAVRVDLKHMNEKTFSMVLRHLYADTGEELFDDVVTDNLDEFIDIVIEVMFAANELMIDRLAQVCQRVLGKFVNVRNVCSLLNTVSECTVDSFKHAALEYICLNLESMLEMRLLDELDEDLLTELDDVVQANQLAFLPFARSERAEEELLENYPELLENIELCRQRRIDSMRLRSRLSEDEERHTSATKFKVGSLDKQTSSYQKSPLPNPAADSPLSTPSPSPAIVPNDVGDDLPFDMDDVTPDLLPAALQQGMLPQARSPSLPAHASVGHKSEVVGPRHPTTPRTPRDEFARSNRAQQDHVSPVVSPGLAITGFDTPRTAWNLPTQNSPHGGLKDIMAQASASRVSNLTNAVRAGSAGPRGGAKMSQKERKRQQQMLKDEGVKTSSLTAALKDPNSKGPSPWQAISAPSKPALPLGAAIPDRDVGIGRMTPARPAMTMRQTVAGSASTGHGADQSAERGSGPPRLASSPKSAAPQIQSIRHTPLPSRATSAIDARTSMTEILAQQQFEKAAVKEAVAKRSLQEIQQEQEFQEWWDNESRRVQEEAQSHRPASNRGKGGRGRGGPRRSSGKGKASAGPEAGGREKTVSVSSSTVRGDSGQGRGSGRGGGLGNNHPRGARHQPCRHSTP